MLSEKRHRDSLNADVAGVVVGDQRILESNLTGESSRVRARGTRASSSARVAARLDEQGSAVRAVGFWQRGSAPAGLRRPALLNPAALPVAEQRSRACAATPLGVNE